MTDPNSPSADQPDPAADPAAEPVIDAEFEEAPPPRKSGGAVRAAIAAIVLLALVAAGFAAWRMTGGDPVETEPAITAEPEPQPGFSEPGAAPPAPVDTADAAELADLRARLAALEARPAPEAPAPDAEDLADLRDQIENLRRATEAARELAAHGAQDPALGAWSDPAFARMQDRLDQIEERLAELRDRIERTPAPGDIEALEERIAALEAQDLQGEAEAAWRFAALREAAARGAPFEAQRAALARLRPGDADLAALADAAAAGVPTIQELRGSFPAEAIRQAAAAAPGEETSWMRRLMARFVTVRREAGDLDPAQGAVDAAEAALAAGDLPRAVSAVEDLDGPAAEAASYWLGRAQARLRLDRRMERVQDSLAGEGAQ